jgi:hypothetical protein
MHPGAPRQGYLAHGLTQDVGPRAPSQPASGAPQARLAPWMPRLQHLEQDLALLPVGWGADRKGPMMEAGSINPALPWRSCRLIPACAQSVPAPGCSLSRCCALTLMAPPPPWSWTLILAG